MAQNSISRLAIHIVTDTKGMTAGFSAAQHETKRFSQEIERGNGKLAQLGKVGADAAKSFGGTGGMAFKLGAVAGPVGVATASVAALAVGMARLADSAEDFRIEKLREVGAIGPDVKTTAEMFGDLREQISTFAELSGFSMKPLLADLKELARSANVLVFGEEAVRNLERQNAEARTALERFKERQKAEEAAQKAAEKAAEEARKRQDDLRKRGDDIAKSLRTPLEIFQDTLRELRSLGEAGVISNDILERGAQKAAAEYMKATDTVKRFKNELRGVSAVEQTSREFRSAFLSGQRKSDDSQRKTTDTALLERIAKATEAELGRPVVAFKKGAL